MDITSKKNRSDLKAFFEKNKIPTQEQFAFLIDSMINQQDDRVAKLPDEPLSLEALGDFQKVINFYQTFDNNPPAWSLQLLPHDSTNNTKAGLCIADGSTNQPRLFIDKATGNIGIGTISPTAPLDIRNAGGTEGIGISANTISATGNKDNQDIVLAVKGDAGVLHLTGVAYISPDTNVDGIRKTMSNGSLSIGSTEHSYGHDSPTMDTVPNRAGLAMSTNKCTEIAVNHASVRLVSLMYYDGNNNIKIGRDMGWGVTPVTIAGNLVVNGSVTNANNANQWQTPSLLNNWVNYDSTFNPAQYRIDGDGVVWLRGLVKNGRFYTNIFQLPSGYWPSYRQLHVVCTWANNTAVIGIGRVDVDTSGFVSFQYGSSNLTLDDGSQGGWISLDGIAFRAAPSS